MKEILEVVKSTVQKTGPDYNLVIKRLYLYYDIKLVTFGMEKDRNLIIQFPVFVQPYTQQLLILYQVETALVLIIDKNIQAHSCTHIQVDRPYIGLYNAMSLSGPNMTIESI